MNEFVLGAFTALRNDILSFLTHFESGNKNQRILKQAVEKSCAANTWFTEESIRFALQNIACILDENSMKRWQSVYAHFKALKKQKTVAVINAGNIPAVGFADFFYVIVAGFQYLGKLSQKDNFLLPALAKILKNYEPSLENSIHFTTETIKDFDAVIATGSDNSARYFEYYFKKFPHIIRKNRSSLAVLNENTSKEDLQKLGMDIFTYFGLGCRNVSKVYLPESFDLQKLVQALDEYAWVQQHYKYMNNYHYHKSVFLMEKIPFLDNGFLLLTENSLLHSPLSTLYYEYYKDENSLRKILHANQEQIQCIVGNTKAVSNTIGFGRSQSPVLSDYADDVDVMAFLKQLA